MSIISSSYYFISLFFWQYLPFTTCASDAPCSISLVSAATCLLSLVRPAVSHSDGCRGHFSPADSCVRSFSVTESEGSMAGRLLLRACTTTTLQLRSNVVARPLHRAMSTAKGNRRSEDFRRPDERADYGRRGTVMGHKYKLNWGSW